MNINNKIKDHRERKNMTQETLAFGVGVSRQTIIALEKGNYEPSLGLAMKLANFFSSLGEKVSVEDLFQIQNK